MEIRQFKKIAVKQNACNSAPGVAGDTATPPC